MQAAPTFNAYRFQIAETGTAWLLGPENLPGAFAIGGWNQTGTLTLSTPQSTITQNGTHGIYAFASQRLWRANGDGDARGASGFVQLGANNSRTMIATRYIGLGVTAFGVVPGRPSDSLGAGFAWSGLNRAGGHRSDEALVQVYDQIQVFGPIYLQPTLTISPNPGDKDRPRARCCIHAAVHGAVLIVPQRFRVHLAQLYESAPKIYFLPFAVSFVSYLARWLSKNRVNSAKYSSVSGAQGSAWYCPCD